MAEDKRTAIISINIDNGAAIKRIADLSRAVDANKKHVKDLQKSLKELDKTSEDYASQVEAITEEIAATNAQTTEYKRTMSDLNRVVANTVRENMNNEGSLKSLRAELSRLTNEYDSLGRAQREGLEGQELQSRISAITDELNKNEGATGRFHRNVGGYENDIKKALGLNQGFGSSLIGIADSMNFTNGIIPGLRGGIIGLGGAMKALAANPVFLTILGVSKIAEGVKFWFDFNKGLSEATRLTEQFTGLSGDALTNYRDKVQSVADVYGKDFKDVMQSANALANQFGISYDEAITVIKDGFVSGADVSGNFLDTVKEYPAFFREAGLSASEFVAISTEAVKQGVFSDKGVDAIKEATIRLREMSKSTDEALAGIGLSGEEIQQAMANGTMTAFDAIQKVSEKLNELPETSSAVGTAVADIFGGAGEDAGVQYLKTLKDISTDLDEVKDKAGEYARVQDEYLQSEIELQQATNELFGGMSESFDNLMTQGKTFLNNVLSGMLNGILEFNATVGATFVAIRVYVDEAMKSFASLGEMLKAVVTLQWGDVGSAWDKWISEVGVAGSKAGEAYTKAYNEAVEKTAETTNNPSSTSPTTGVVLPGAKTSKSSKTDNKELQKALDALEKYEQQLRQIIIDNTYTAIEQVNAKYDAEIAELEKSFEANKQYADNIEELERRKNEAITALNKARADEISDINAKASKEEEDRLVKELADKKAAEAEKARLEKEAAELIAKTREDEEKKREALYSATSSMFSAMSDMISATSESEEEAARRGKVLALAEIAFNTGVAIAEGVASASAVPFPFNLAAIVTTIATVLSNIAAATKAVQTAKFADGGLVTGPGTATSDSIPAMLSNGESVMTAEATSMFGPMLSAFNQMGGGVPISSNSNATGEEMLARAFARGVESMPAPVVNVQEITRVADRVRVLENLAKS
jgi:ABC-type transporter Mla subunit MlaD